MSEEAKSGEGDEGEGGKESSLSAIIFAAALLLTVFWVTFNIGLFVRIIGSIEADGLIAALSAPIAALPAFWIVVAVFFQMNELRNQRIALSQNLSALEQQATEVANSVQEAKTQNQSLREEIELRRKQDLRVQAQQSVTYIGEILIIIDQKARSIYSGEKAPVMSSDIMKLFQARPGSFPVVFSDGWGYICNSSLDAQFEKSARPVDIREFLRFLTEAKSAMQEQYILIMKSGDEAAIAQSREADVLKVIDRMIEMSNIAS